jgi:hypothetical protein
MSEFSWGVLINKLLNLGMLIVACAYLVKKYLAPYIKKSLKQRAERLFALEQEAVELRVKKAEIMREMEEQKIQAEQLLWKIQLWKNVMEERENVYAIERKQIEKNSLEYLKKRADGLCQEFLRREVIPQIFIQTQEQVRHFFADEKTQKEYITAALKRFACKEKIRG